MDSHCSTLSSMETVLGQVRAGWALGNYCVLTEEKKAERKNDILCFLCSNLLGVAQEVASRCCNQPLRVF